jgi:hypothetical protein
MRNPIGQLSGWDLEGIGNRHPGTLGIGVDGHATGEWFGTSGVSRAAWGMNGEQCQEGLGVEARASRNDRLQPGEFCLFIRRPGWQAERAEHVRQVLRASLGFFLRRSG